MGYPHSKEMTLTRSGRSVAIRRGSRPRVYPNLTPSSQGRAARLFLRYSTRRFNSKAPFQVSTTTTIYWQPPTINFREEPKVTAIIGGTRAWTALMEWLGLKWPVIITTNQSKPLPYPFGNNGSFKTDILHDPTLPADQIVVLSVTGDIITTLSAK